MPFVTMKPRPDFKEMEKYITDFVEEIFSYNHSHEFLCDICFSDGTDIQVEYSLTILDQWTPPRTKPIKVSFCEEFAFSDAFTEARIQEEMQKICDEVINQLLRDAFFECYRHVYEQRG